MLLLLGVVNGSVYLGFILVVIEVRDASGAGNNPESFLIVFF